MAVLSHALVTQEDMSAALDEAIAAQERGLELLRIARDSIASTGGNGTPRPGPMEAAIELPPGLECRKGKAYVSHTDVPTDVVAWLARQNMPLFTIGQYTGLSIHEIEACVSWDAAMRRANGEGRPQ